MFLIIKMNSITDIAPLKLSNIVSSDNDNDTNSFSNAGLSFSNFKNMLRRV